MRPLVGPTCGRRVASETCVSRHHFDEKSGNEAFSNDIDHNAKQIACSSRDGVWGFGEVQGDARGRDAVRAEPSRVRSSRPRSNLRVSILVTAWTAHLTRTGASTTTCAVAAKWINARVATSIKFEETATYDPPEVMYAAAATTTSTSLLTLLR